MKDKNEVKTKAFHLRDLFTIGDDADDDDADESFVGEDETYNKYSISIKSCSLLQILHPKSFC